MQSAPVQTSTPTSAAANSDERQLVVFQLGAELYGVEISRVHEIIRLQQVTRVPHVLDLDRVLTREERRVLEEAA